MCPGAWSAWLSKHTPLSEMLRKLNAVFLQSGKRGHGQTSQEQAANSSPPSRRKAHYISLCTFVKKKRKRGTDTESRLFCYMSKTLGLAALLFFPAVYSELITISSQQLVFLTSHPSIILMLCERQETRPEALVCPLLQSTSLQAMIYAQTADD